MQKGNINVQTENIFPIIKKFLYTDNEIFLRELVSNAVDATQKLKTLSSLGKVKDDLGDLRIEVILDKKNKTLTIRDKGIGMTSDEVEKYINQIAFSSAEDFVKKFKGKEADAKELIGHFGLGFYSSFMVADKVEILSKTYKKGGKTKAVNWVCDGSTEYTISEIDEKERGTDVVLHISKDDKEFLEESKILELLKKYCKFLPIEIIFGKEKISEKIEGEKDKDGKDKYKEIEKDRIINNVNPAWKIKPTELKDEDYKKFYRELYPMTFEEPLFQIHLNVDYPFNLTGVLYFPKIKKNIEVQKNKIQLYCNQVFVTDSIEGIVPDFLTLLHGVIDSPDIPLNVSRSALQSDSNVKKISNHIMKKVGDKLDDMFKNNREDFEAKWDDIKVFIEYGIISEPKFYDRAIKFFLFKNLEGKYFTLEEYKEHIKANQTNKDKKIVHLYTNNIEDQFNYIEIAKEKGYDILIMDSPIDNHFLNLIEQKFTDSAFTRVDADVIDKLINKEETQTSKLSEDEQKSLKEVIEKNIDKQKFNIVVESLSETDQPMIITKPEFMRRMKEMSEMSGGMGGYMGMMPDNLNLVVNGNHSIIYDIFKEEDEEKQANLIQQLVDLALLSQNLLKGEKLTKFIKRSVNIIK